MAHKGSLPKGIRPPGEKAARNLPVPENRVVFPAVVEQINLIGLPVPANGVVVVSERELGQFPGQRRFRQTHAMPGAENSSILHAIEKRRNSTHPSRPIPRFAT